MEQGRLVHGIPSAGSKPGWVLSYREHSDSSENIVLFRRQVSIGFHSSGSTLHRKYQGFADLREIYARDFIFMLCYPCYPSPPHVMT